MIWEVFFSSIGRARPQGYLNHAFMHHCTSLHHLRAQWRAVMHRWTRSQHQVHFCATLLIPVLEIRFNFQFNVQCAEKAISKITFIIWWNLKQICHLWHTWVSKGNIKGFENNVMGFECPDKHDKTGFGSVARGRGNIFCVVILPWLTHLPLEKMPPFHRRYFQMHFREWKVLYFD